MSSCRAALSLTLKALAASAPDPFIDARSTDVFKVLRDRSLAEDKLGAYGLETGGTACREGVLEGM